MPPAQHVKGAAGRNEGIVLFHHFVGVSEAAIGILRGKRHRQTRHRSRNDVGIVEPQTGSPGFTRCSLEPGGVLGIVMPLEPLKRSVDAFVRVVDSGST